MIYGAIFSDGLDTLGGEIHDFFDRVYDIGLLAGSVAEAMETGNMADRLRGVDRWGEPYQPLAESTLKRNPYRIDDTPLIPMGLASRAVSGFQTDITMIGHGSAEVVGSWPTMEPFMIFHVTGTKHMPARNPAGLTLPSWAAIADVFDSWLDGIAGATFDG